MKFILTIFLSFIFIATACAGDSKNKITIVSNAKTCKLEIKFISNYKKNLQRNVVIIDVEGNEVKSFKCILIKGSNTISMQDALDLKEGIYTNELEVKNKKSSTKFVLFNKLDTNS